MKTLSNKSIYVNKKVEINIGIQLLRVICCFLVILCHFYGFYQLKFLINKHQYYMMIFFVLSFYFSYKNIVSKKIMKIKERFKRILIPYIIWPVLFFIKDKLNHYLCGNKELYHFKQLYYQLLIGCGIYGIFWFLFNLLLLSVFFTLIIFIFKKKYTLVLFIICVCDYFWYYSNNTINQFFNQFKAIPVHHSIKQIFFYYIFVFSGFYFASKNLLGRLYKYRIISIIFSGFIVLIFINYYYVFTEQMLYFYRGIINNIFVLNCIILFAMIPFDKFKNKKAIIILQKITSHTGGIYYLHVQIGNLLAIFFYLNKSRSFLGCLLIYLFCYLICIVGTFALRKFILKNLFI